MLDGTLTARAETRIHDPAEAVAAIAAQISGGIAAPDLAGVIFFCSADYPAEALSLALREHFDCPLIGCTSAGEIGSRYQEGGMVALGLSSRAFRLHTTLIDPVSDFDSNRAEQLARKLQPNPQAPPWSSLGLLLIDGLSLQEEQTIASLHHALEDTPIIGGSAGDSLRFQQTRVYAEGGFHSGAAVFSLIESRLPFSTFRQQHFVPSERDMVITEADPQRRIVYEIDGGPAAEEYARINGLDPHRLAPQTFSKYPVMLEIGDEWYVRSIEKVNEDGSLTFFCAIDNGLPLTVARGIGLVDTLRRQVEEIEERFSDIAFTLGCDCILRRLEIMDSGQREAVESLLRRIRFIGFSTFGEQYNAVHVNQTLTGVVFGSRSNG